MHQYHHKMSSCAINALKKTLLFSGLIFAVPPFIQADQTVAAISSVEEVSQKILLSAINEPGYMRREPSTHRSIESGFNTSHELQLTNQKKFKKRAEEQNYSHGQQPEYLIPQ